MNGVSIALVCRAFDVSETRYRYRPKPQQNAYLERYNRTVRHELPDRHIFEGIDEVLQIATEWPWSCDNERPNMGSGGVTPARKLRTAAWFLRQSPRKSGGITVGIDMRLHHVRQPPWGFRQGRGCRPRAPYLSKSV